MLGWYIMVETGSVLLLTVLASLQYVGTLIAPVLGMVGDRIGHRLRLPLDDVMNADGLAALLADIRPAFVKLDGKFGSDMVPTKMQAQCCGSA